MSRQSIEVEGFAHGPQPIPAASRKGNIVVTGGVFGLDPATGKLPDDLEAQAVLMFYNLKRILAAAGASMECVLKMTVFVKTPEARTVINKHWLEAFTDPASRPARHTLRNEHMPENMLIQCDAIAVLD
jgi:enamine deaminase RidA (YjgF/YER057c/UK114 family)